MKHNKHHDNAPGGGPKLEAVHFEFTHPTAHTVCIAGTFNDWQPEAKPMHPLRGSLAEGIGLAGWHLRMLPRCGREMDARSAGQRDRGQSVRGKKLGSSGGQHQLKHLTLARGRRPPCRCAFAVKPSTGKNCQGIGNASLVTGAAFREVLTAWCAKADRLMREAPNENAYQRFSRRKRNRLLLIN